MLKATNKARTSTSPLHIIESKKDLQFLAISDSLKTYASKQIDKKSHLINSVENSSPVVILLLKEDKSKTKQLELIRQQGAKVTQLINSLNLKDIQLLVADKSAVGDELSLALAEGMVLSNYQFLKYKSKSKELKHSLETIYVDKSCAAKAKVVELQNTLEAVYQARTWINEPLNYLTAPTFASEIKSFCGSAGVKVTVFNKKRIEKEKMGGILAVNYGSIDEPRFSILEWKPSKPVNKKPIVLVGKGVTFDTGGLSLKPTGNSMDHMKCDMAGAAAVAGALYAIAKNKLNVHVIGLVPSTDNRPGLNAYVPSDVITMHNGSTVEVLNTDAEGRMLLADGLSYAKRYKPELVIDIATLTGASLTTIAQQGMLLMANTDNESKETIKEASHQVFERLAELPLWEEFGDLLKSDIADLKNVGGKFGGSITAAKFLEHFTDYPWFHIDMAPMGWMYSEQGYRLKNGSGAGVRLFYQFIKMRAQQ